MSQPKTEIELLMDDMLNRVEVKAMHEYEISRKIVNIRAALRSASKSEEQVSQDVKIFQTTRVPNPEKVEGVKWDLTRNKSLSSNILNDWNINN